MNKQTTYIAIRFNFLLSGLLLCFMLQSCDDGGSTREIPYVNPHFTSELSLGRVTVFNDVYFSLYDWPVRYIAVGYRDSLGNGKSEPIIAVLDSKGIIVDTIIIPVEGLNRLSVVTNDRYTNMFIAAGEGATNSQNFFRINTRDSSYASFNIPFEGSTVHPTEILSSESGDIAISGWVEDGGIEKGFLIVIGSDNAIRWSRYYTTPGRNIRCMNMVADDSGYVLAIAESDASSPDANVQSHLQTVSFSGSDRERIGIGVSDFRILDLVRNRDTIYSVVGEIMREPRTGYIGLLNKSGIEFWKFPFIADSLFIPIAIDGAKGVLHNNVVGRRGDFGSFCSIYEIQGKLFFTGPGKHPWAVYLSIRGMDIIEGPIFAAIRDYSYDGSGNLTKAKAVIIR